MSYQQQALGWYNRFQTEINNSSHLGRIEEQTKIPRQYLVLGAVGLYFFLIFLNVGGIGQLFANLAAVAIPGYFSLKALETTTTSDDTQYLTYWVVYAAFTIIEFWSSVLLYWMPFYWLFKTVFFLWLGLPMFGGARVVYQRIVKPFSQNVLGIRSEGVAPNLNERPTARTTGARI